MAARAWGGACECGVFVCLHLRAFVHDCVSQSVLLSLLFLFLLLLLFLMLLPSPPATLSLAWMSTHVLMLHFFFFFFNCAQAVGDWATREQTARLPRDAVGRGPQASVQSALTSLKTLLQVCVRDCSAFVLFFFLFLIYLFLFFFLLGIFVFILGFLLFGFFGV